ncbi:MAG TPA: asparagine synthase (glutamine-hydrolyzing) [Planctomycetota bacterium]|nr:asparagine synthase (glutamine-hydrolyzing) [Planctomycetota bacterium]
MLESITMCGICGRINFDPNGTSFGRNTPVSDDLMHRMCDTIIHRGPDSEGIFNSQSQISNPKSQIALGIRRLAIIDLTTGDQPIHNEDKSIWLVLNGEIYNFQELRDGLLKKGHSFYTKTDTEVIVHLYEEYGVDCVKHLRGMFALALWDNNKGQLFLARDRLGKKPLYYAQTDRYLIFGSEMKAILANPEIKKEVDLDALDYYLTYYYIPSPLSIFKGIRKLPPASYLVCDANGAIKIERYWQIDYRAKHSLSQKEYCNRIMELLEESTKIRMISDVPLGALLSGGIDSSAIVGLMARNSSKPIKTFSIGFGETGYSELKYAKLVAEHFKTEHHEFIVTPKVIDILPDLVWHYGEPYADSSMLPSYYVARETRKHVTVALNGDGGDENFAGYPRYLAQKLMSLPLARILSRMANLLIPPLGPADPKSFFTRLKRFTAVAGLNPAQRYLVWQLCFNSAYRQKLYSPLIRDKINQPSENYLMDIYNHAKADNHLDRMLYTDVTAYLPEDLLVKMDIASMANSLESRSPFLDHKLMEFSAGIPANLKLKGFTLKHLLKKSLKGFLPDEILMRGKMGFGVPISRWFRGELKGYLQEILSAESIRKRGYLQPEPIQELIRQHLAGQADHGARLWALLVLELWFREFID